jgi:hypothetical protein
LSSPTNEEHTRDQLAGLRRSLDLRAILEQQLDEHGRRLLDELLDQHAESAQQDYEGNLEALYRLFPCQAAAMRAIHHHLCGMTIPERDAYGRAES